MMSRLQQAFSTILVILIVFAISCSAKPWSSSSGLYRYDDSHISQFQPNPGYLSRTYLFNWIPESSEEGLTPTKRNIAIGRGDGFRPGK
uniref:Uncharacterized protein n=1 Tax=Panagrolaimus sp. PS1159 TaxID=55785 RepID=A0AC35F628_9BILA